MQNNDCKAEKSCTVAEYMIDGVGEEPIISGWTYSLEYGFPDPKASKERLINPYKTVHKEYLVWTEIALVAYVGGMLGLTLGFSFPSILEWMFDITSTALRFAYNCRAKNKY